MSKSPFADQTARQYDALLIVSFGGPEGMDDVEPFLDNVLQGLTLSDSARRKIEDRYRRFGGVSPIARHTRDLVRAVQAELEHRGLALPVYLGNRNWHPLLPDTLRAMAADGIERAAAFVTSLFGSYSGCRRYREDLHHAADGLQQAPASWIAFDMATTIPALLRHSRTRCAPRSLIFRTSEGPGHRSCSLRTACRKQQLETPRTLPNFGKPAGW